MKGNRVAVIALLSLISAGVFFITGYQYSSKSGNSLDKEQVNAMIRDYILTNPEIIPDAIEVLRARQNANALLESEELLYNDGYSHIEGNPDGDITIVEFYDYNCGYCKQVPEDLARLLEEDGNIRVIFKELPILAESSEYASIAAMAAQKQGKFMDFHNALMQNRRQLTEELILEIARDSGIDEEQLLQDMADPEIEANIMKNKYLVQNLGISGTPGFIIGTQVIPGYIPFDRLKDIVAEERQTQQM
ncbi:DsbA family protein [Pseudemcibacter aquimaris]|uniref:DsbA family protein n=1 Tax=Pseudemcibacter aquimaris TaxID=2857064 RepID=UPI002013B9F3|nr:DsbA family protein [Pseudemcibacter aquimaris]MCC3860901.1 DsbA family protein [Pseudemcibacter aquimaris]WDU59720.1 DsbA family protein [Pseudemcibacter aquimaris]